MQQNNGGIAYESVLEVHWNLFWVVLSLACVVKEGEFTVIYFLKFIYTRGRVYCFPSKISYRESLLWKREILADNWSLNWQRRRKRSNKFFSQISVCYDMLCCHQCQRGRLLDTIIQLSVVFDVTQMSYQLSINLYRAQLVCKVIYNVYRAQLVCKVIYSVYRAFPDFTLCR